MKKTIATSYLLMLVGCLAGCRTKPLKIFTLTNDLEFSRTEILTIDVKDLGLQKDDLNNIIVEDSGIGKHLPLQFADLDTDNTFETLYIEADLAASEKKHCQLYLEHEEKHDSINGTYGRFAPERIDDFAWENDRVAFRTYGPEAQRLVDAGKNGGTLSSGIDCWLKRVDYSIIDKWYKKYATGGTYHKDDGEGYDPYHVGASRGCGGLGVLVGDSLYVSKNFITHKVLANGPLRTTVELAYAPWAGDKATITEKKTITIDRHNQLCKIDELLMSSQPTSNFTIGITLHEKKGTVNADSTMGWFRYWETIDDSELGTGICIEPKYIQQWKDFRTEKKDLSHVYIVSKSINNHLVYYSGFGWKKAEHITSPALWDAYLIEFARRVNSPVKVAMVK